MKAAVIHEHGGLDKIVYEDFPEPEVRPGDVLVRIGAVALNYLDVFTRRGMPGIKVRMPMITGGDMAGEIARVGAEVDGWQVGDRVSVYPIDWEEGGMMGETMHGGLAEFARTRPHQLIRLPDNVSYEDAASLPVAYGTAHRMVMTRGAIRAGEKVLILGASGGVGTGAVLLCKMLGAEVIACTGSDAKGRRLSEIGADHVINYETHDFVEEIVKLYGKPRFRGGGGGVDVVINFTGGDTWPKSLRTLRLQGRMLTCGATAGYDPKTDIRYIWTFELNIVGSNGWSKDDQAELIRLVSEGRLKPAIDRVMPLSETREAVRMLEDREVFGKLVLVP